MYFLILLLHKAATSDIGRVCGTCPIIGRAVRGEGGWQYEINSSTCLLMLLLHPSWGSDLWLIRRSRQSGGTKRNFGLRSERLNENPDRLLSQVDRTLPGASPYGSFGGRCDTGGSPLTPRSLVLVVLDPCWCTAPPSEHKWVIERQQFTARRSFKSVCGTNRLLFKCFSLINIKRVGGRGRSNCSYICCGWQVAEARSLPLANMLHHCELWHTHRWLWRRNPLRHDSEGTPRRWVSP